MNKELARKILKETAEYYNLNNRAVGSHPTAYSGESCKYYIDFNNQGVADCRCGIGRLVSMDQAKKLELECAAKRVSFLIENRLLPPEIHELGLYFLQDIQSLHDDKDNWVEDGISENGGRKVNLIYNKIIENKY